MDRILSTGTIVKEYMLENNVMLSMLEANTGLSSRTLLRFLNEGAKISYAIANGIHELIPEISTEFLLTYDAKYRLNG